MTPLEAINKLNALLKTVDENLGHCLMLDQEFITGAHIYIGRRLIWKLPKTGQILGSFKKLENATVKLFTWNANSDLKTEYSVKITDLYPLFDRNERQILVLDGRHVIIQIAKMQKVGCYMNDMGL